MTDTITLTREQYEAVLAQADLAVSYADDLHDLREALTVLGCEVAVKAIAVVQREINECRNEITRTMLRADDDQPVAVKPRAMPKWFWPFNKSNKEA